MNARVFGAAFALLLGGQALATGVAPVNLVDLTHQADLIFEGRCTAVERTSVLGVDGKLQIPAVRYTFEVTDALKGGETGTLSFAHLGKPAPGEPEFFFNPEWVGMPTYEVGRSYLLFIDPRGSSGLTAPCGISQGVFEVRAGAAHLAAKDGSYLFYGLERLLERAGYQALVAPVVAKSGAKVGLDLGLLKLLVRDLLSGKVTGPRMKEMLK